MVAMESDEAQSSSHSESPAGPEPADNAHHDGTDGEGDDDDDDSLFVLRMPRKRRVSTSAGVKLAKRIKIHIASLAPESAMPTTTTSGGAREAQVVEQLGAPQPRSAAAAAASSSASAAAIGPPASFPPPLVDDIAIMQSIYSPATSVIPPDELEDSLAFFRDTHEDQDPAYQQLERASHRATLNAQLAALTDYDESTRRDIDQFIRDQLHAKQASAQVSLEKYKLRATQDEQRDTKRLYEVFTSRSAANLQKIHQGMQVLRDRHKAELQAAQQNHHRTNNSNRQGQGQHGNTPLLSPEQLAADWHNVAQQIQQKQQRQLAEFAKKADELKQKMAADYQREQDKIRQQLDSRLENIQVNRQKISEKLQVSFQQIRQRYIKRHLQKLEQQKQDLLAKLAALDNASDNGGADTIKESSDSTYSSSSDHHHHQHLRGVAKAVIDDRVEFRQPAPIRSTQPWALDHASGAAARHKHRKTVMSQSTRQLSVEIHNEGLWVTLIIPQKESSETKSADNGKMKKEPTDEFIVWGVGAHDVLYSIACGEIPVGFDKFDFGDAAEIQSGQVRCVLTDLRTSDESAAELRAACMNEYEQEQFVELKTQADAMVNMAADTEKQSIAASEEEKTGLVAADAARKVIEKYTRTMDEFMHKFRQYFGPDGQIITSNPNDRQKLEGAVNDLKAKLAHAEEKEMLAKQRATEAKKKREKLSQNVKIAQRNVVIISNAVRQRQVIMSGRATPKQLEAFATERASSRVEDVIGALRKVAEHRRQRINEKKSSSVSMTWLQSFPGLSTSLKKSLWHKMHRRKQQIVLRPTPESIFNELRASILDDSSAASEIPTPNEEALLVKVEQLFLLATHPVAEHNLSNVPGTKSDHHWAEPGCRLDLSVEPRRLCNRILPCRRTYSVLEKNLSEIASAPGRQAASLLRLSHFKCLAAPLSAVAVASSPAEAGAKPNVKKNQGKDPLSFSEKEVMDGYIFSTKPPSAGQGPTKLPPARKKSVTTVEPQHVVTKSVTSPRQQSVTAKNSTLPQSESQQRPVEEKKAPRRRNSSSKAGAALSRRPSDLNISQRSAAVPVESPHSTKSVIGPNYGSATALAPQGLVAPTAINPNGGPTPAQYANYMGQLPVQQTPNLPVHTPQSKDAQQQFLPPAQQQQSSPNFMTPQQRQLALQQMMQQQQHRQLGNSPRRNQQMFAPQALQMQQFYSPLTCPNPSNRGPYHQQPLMPPMGLMPRSVSASQQQVGTNQGHQPPGQQDQPHIQQSPQQGRVQSPQHHPPADSQSQLQKPPQQKISPPPAQPPSQSQPQLSEQGRPAPDPHGKVGQSEPRQSPHDQESQQ